ncbi:Multifunctional CCA protein [Sulfurovum sp. enrichment culture clone C5]|uniref:Multifunctional CCA protein n=1 Tax=Sulfurovum sp. enrichment culture clone C5 TaxID=497650 RepID=A0A0S4XL77_9BACT|nr:Multifunctional CCA protein [Sulfurovum sp. enrichment culture clone C5]
MTHFAITLPPVIKTISDELSKQNFKAILVGGCVRDFFLDLPIKDYDVEVFGIENIETLEEILCKFGTVNLVGKSFGILKFVYGEHEYDFSLPRTETKSSVGHKGFDVVCNGEMDFKSAAIRRDFTINAIGYDMASGEVLDPFGGLEDIERKIVRCVSKDTFAEDPLRVYRAAGFCARFDFEIDSQTLNLCCDMTKKDEFKSLPKERIFVEFKKILLKSPKPSVGFELLRQMGVINYFPELYNIIDIPQSPIHHPEGDVWIHTMMVIDEMAELRTLKEKLDLKLILAALCHDFGKATHTQIEDEKIRAIGHEKAGVELTKDFLYRLTNEHDLVKSVLPLVEHHLVPSMYFKNHARDKKIRHLSTRVNISELLILARADFFGRTTTEAMSGMYEAGDWMEKKAKELGVFYSPPKPFVKGKDLIDLGLIPSPKFSEILDIVYEKQLNGEIKTKEDAFVYLPKIINS